MQRGRLLEPDRNVGDGGAARRVRDGERPTGAGRVATRGRRGDAGEACGDGPGRTRVRHAPAGRVHGVAPERRAADQGDAAGRGRDPAARAGHVRPPARAGGQPPGGGREGGEGGGAPPVPRILLQLPAGRRVPAGRPADHVSGAHHARGRDPAGDGRVRTAAVGAAGEPVGDLRVRRADRLRAAVRGPLRLRPERRMAAHPAEAGGRARESARARLSLHTPRLPHRAGVSADAPDARQTRRPNAMISGRTASSR